MGRTLFLDEPSGAVAEWLERRRALGQDVAPMANSRHGDVQMRVAELLDVDEATLHAEIDWPPV